MGAAASLASANASDKTPEQSIQEGRGYAQLACKQLRSALLSGKVPGHVTVVVDLGFAKRTLAFNVLSKDIEDAESSGQAGGESGGGNVIFPPTTVDAMVKDVKRLTAAVTAHNLDAALQCAAATRCFMAGKILFLVTVSIDPHAFASAPRPSLIRGKTVRELADGLEESLNDKNKEKSEAESSINSRLEKIMEQLKTSGIMLKKHPRKGSPEPRMFWFTGERFCIAKKVQTKVNHRTKGWAVDDPNGFDVIKGIESANFARTLKKYGEVDPEVCLIVQLHDRTIDLQFDNQDTRDAVYDVIKTFLPEIANTMEKKFTTSLGMGIGTRRIVAKVMQGSAAEVNDVRVGDVVLEVAGEEILATMPQHEITDKISAAMKKDGEVLVKFGRAETKEGEQEELPEAQRNVNSLMDLMLRAGQGLARSRSVSSREAKRIVHVSCKHPITELAVDLVVSDLGAASGGDNGGEDFVTGAPPPGSDKASDSTEKNEETAAEGQPVSAKSSYVAPSPDEENRKRLDEAVTLLTANLQPVKGTTGAVSEGAAKFDGLGGTIVLRVAVGSLEAAQEDEKEAENPEAPSVDAPPVLAKEGSMTEMRMLSISDTSESSTHSLTRRMSMEVMQSSKAIGSAAN